MIKRVVLCGLALTLVCSTTLALVDPSRSFVQVFFDFGFVFVGLPSAVFLGRWAALG
jgi:hypothetical protein